MGGSGTTGDKRKGRPAPVLTGDPSTDGALLALARLLLDIAAASTEGRGPSGLPAAGGAAPRPVDDGTGRSEAKR